MTKKQINKKIKIVSSNLLEAKRKYRYDDIISELNFNDEPIKYSHFDECIVASLMKHMTEPTTAREALDESNPFRKEWKIAMDKELKNHDIHGTFEKLSEHNSIPKGRKPVRTR